MRSFAFFNFPARGHINPTLPIVKELTARGADVHYFVSEEYRETVETAGARFHPLPGLARLGRAEVESRGASGDRQIALIPFAMAYQATQVVPKLIEEICALRTDCLVYNTLSLWPRLAQRILGVPAVSFRPFHGPRTHRSVVGPFATERMTRFAAAANRELTRLMEAFGQPSITLHELVSQVEDCVLLFLPREFQQGAEAFDKRFLFVGPSFIEESPEPWPLEGFSSKGLARAYISLGTLRNEDPNFYRTCFAAFKPDNWQVVMSVGDRVDLDSLGLIPSNFVVAHNVRQTAVLSDVDIFVTHGGLNSTMESLYFAVPMIVVPSIKEQRLTARRVRELGLGLVLEREHVTPGSLEESASTLLRAREIKASVSAMQRQIRAAGGYQYAVEAIMEYAMQVSGPHSAA